MSDFRVASTMALFLWASVHIGCGSNTPGAGGGGGMSGSSAGASGNGGATADGSSGSGGSLSNGGSSGSGGSLSNGGSTTDQGGSGAGGVLATGGRMGSGGASATAGAQGTGGAASEGGSQSSGGAPGSGGSSGRPDAGRDSGPDSGNGGSGLGGAVSTGGGNTAGTGGGGTGTGGTTSSTFWPNAYKPTTGSNGMNTGQDCMSSCHNHGFALGGTVYDSSGKPKAQVEIGIKPTSGSFVSVFTGSDGNFHYSGAGLNLAGADIRIRDSAGEAQMPTNPSSSGACNGCHTGGTGTPRISAP
jgi:hypothetical protein